MRRPALLALALLATAACSKSPCQQLGEKLCTCTGITSENCTLQVQRQVNATPLDDSTCQDTLDACDNHAPEGSDFCTWLHTADGKRYCGLAPFEQPGP
jgi:hypothetical protein